MREIKFRGKLIDNNKWAYGDLLHESNCVSICRPGWYSIEIAPETIGQYTGLKDENDVEIYENDIVEFSYKDTNYIVKIFWDKNDLTYKIEYLSKSNLNFCNSATLYKSQKKSALENLKIKVIGNIYDNPELLQEKEKQNEIIRNY